MLRCRFRSKPELPRVIARSLLETLAFLKETYGAFHSGIIPQTLPTQQKIPTDFIDINPNNIFLSNVDSACPVVKVG